MTDLARIERELRAVPRKLGWGTSVYTGERVEFDDGTDYSALAALVGRWLIEQQAESSGIWRKCVEHEKARAEELQARLDAVARVECEKGHVAPQRSCTRCLMDLEYCLQDAREEAAKLRVDHEQALTRLRGQLERLGGADAIQG